MARRKKRAGLAYCLASVSFTHLAKETPRSIAVAVRIEGLAIYPDKATRDKAIEDREATSLFPADIWIEEH